MKFIEVGGGDILHLYSGKIVASVNVSALTIDDARRVMDALILGLDAAFDK